MPGRRLRLSKKGLHEDARRLRSVPRGASGGVALHPLLGAFHSDTDIASPAEGALVLADDTPEWNILLHPAAAGYAMVTDATTWTIDQTPTWTGDHTWDDGAGDSPALHLIPENNDDWHIWAANDATPGNSDLIIKFPAADTDALILFRDSGDNDVAHIDGDGNTTWDGAAHRFGIADTTGAILTLSGDAAGDEGGQFSIELSGAHDGVFNSWNVDVSQDDLRFFRSDAGVVNQMTAEGLLALSVAGAAAGLLIAGDAQWYRSAANVMATPDDLYLAGAGLGIIHVDGVAAGAILVANGTRYVPGTIADAGGAPNDAQYLTLALDGDLSAERRFVPGNGLAGTDGGADGDYDLVVDLVAAWSGLEFSGGDLRIDLDATFDAWTGVHTHAANVVMDDNAGNSPSVQFVGGSFGDTAILYLADSGVAGNSDFGIVLPAADADARLLVQTSAFDTVAWIDATGDALFADVTTDDLSITTGHGIIHADGVAAGWLLVADGTRYVPANAAASLPIAPGNRGDIIRAEAGPLWAAYGAATLGAVLIGDGTDIISDTTPTFVDDITLDKNGGNSPLLYFITVSDDEIKLLADDTFGDFRLLLSEAAGVSSFLVEDSAGAFAFGVDSNGNATVGANLTVPRYIIHDGDVDTYLDFTADQIAIWAGAAQLLTITQDATNTILFGAQADLNGNDLIIDTDGDSYLHESADDVVDLVLAGAAGEFGITINAAEDFTFTANSFNVASGSIIDVNSIFKVRSSGDLTVEADIWMAGDGGISAVGNMVMLIDSDASTGDARFEIAKDADKREPLVSGVPLWSVYEDSIQEMRLDGIAHGATAQVKHTDTFFQLQWAETNSGGVRFVGAKDSGGVNAAAMQVRGLLGEDVDTTKSTAGRGIVELQGWQISGTGPGNVVADGNVVVIRTWASGADTTRFIFDTEGSAHADVEWTTFDDHDDVALLDALESSFGEFAEDHQADLERLKIATYDGTPGHAMVNWTRLAMLHNGAIRQTSQAAMSNTDTIQQMNQRLERYEQALLELGANPALLEAQ